MHSKTLLDNLDIWTSAIEKKATSGRGRNGKISLYGMNYPAASGRGIVVEQTQYITASGGVLNPELRNKKTA